MLPVYRPNTESFGYRKVPKGFRFDREREREAFYRDQRAPVPIGRMSLTRDELALDTKAVGDARECCNVQQCKGLDADF